MSGPPTARSVRVVEARHPRDDRAVVEAQDELGAHRHPAAASRDDPHEVGRLAAQRHEVDERDGALRGLELGLQDQGAGPVAAGDLRLGGGRRAGR